jgi:hypothetical protein
MFGIIMKWDFEFECNRKETKYNGKECLNNIRFVTNFKIYSIIWNQNVTRSIFKFWNLKIWNKLSWLNWKNQCVVNQVIMLLITSNSLRIRWFYRRQCKGRYSYWLYLHGNSYFPYSIYTRVSRAYYFLFQSCSLREGWWW